MVTADEVDRIKARAGADDFTVRSGVTDGGCDDDIGRRVDLATVVTADEVDGREAGAGTDEFNVGDFFGTSDNDAGGTGCNDDEVSGGAARWADVFDEGCGNSAIGFEHGSSGADGVGGRDDEIRRNVDLAAGGSVVTADEAGGTEAGDGAGNFTVGSSGTDGDDGRDDEMFRRVDLATGISVVTVDEVGGREAGALADDFILGGSFGTPDKDACGGGCDGDEISGGIAGWVGFFDIGEVLSNGVAVGLCAAAVDDSEDTKLIAEDGRNGCGEVKSTEKFVVFDGAGGALSGAVGDACNLFSGAESFDDRDCLVDCFARLAPLVIPLFNITSLLAFVSGVFIFIIMADVLRGISTTVDGESGVVEPETNSAVTHALGVNFVSDDNKALFAGDLFAEEAFLFDIPFFFHVFSPNSATDVEERPAVVIVSWSLVFTAFFDDDVVGRAGDLLE
ncbi:unnamed protein product [Gongylonema pulchrum]|uniref:Na_Ca_ex domain-containing protein n=1 Tax=Gongylonema pulchrum TaxID=637853 RepID=A0A183DNM8_9BILA|nr:unnamed protein product [Gongylonema pulchrum]